MLCFAVGDRDRETTYFHIDCVYNIFFCIMVEIIYFDCEISIHLLNLCNHCIMYNNYLTWHCYWWCGCWDACMEEGACLMTWTACITLMTWLGCGCDLGLQCYCSNYYGHCRMEWSSPPTHFYLYPHLAIVCFKP